MAPLESLLGEITPKLAAQRERYGVFHAGWAASEAKIEIVPITSRPVKRPACKTCAGRGCVGHCRF